MPTRPELSFCYDVATLDEWAQRTGIPLTSVDALNKSYRYAREWILRIRAELIANHGFTDVAPLDPKILFDIETPYPGFPLRPKLRLRIPAHATTFFAPERRVQWEMVFHSNVFHLLRHTVRPISDLLNLLQCLLTGMFLLIMEEDVPGQGGVRTIRALPPADWVAGHESELVKIFGSTHYRQLLRSASDTRIAFKCENITRH
ncbi:hypothetical protein BDW22DRAFT_262976 [Trametopsis cervina]|nr:hypothetical protein BDW22DRAFT_262976 [Trametopsis cervina]